MLPHTSTENPIKPQLPWPSYDEVDGQRPIPLQNAQALLLGYLSFYSSSNDNRWISLVVSKSVDISMLKPFIHQHSRVRIIRCDSDDLLWISWQCLAQGNSEALITISDSQALLTDSNKHELEKASSMGNCYFHGFNLDAGFSAKLSKA